MIPPARVFLPLLKPSNVADSLIPVGTLLISAANVEVELESGVTLLDFKACFASLISDAMLSRGLNDLINSIRHQLPPLIYLII